MCCFVGFEQQEIGGLLLREQKNRFRGTGRLSYDCNVKLMVSAAGPSIEGLRQEARAQREPGRWEHGLRRNPVKILSEAGPGGGPLQEAVPPSWALRKAHSVWMPWRGRMQGTG